jgi:hypothetical protein
MRIADDCRRCLARNDGMCGSYCYHAIFAERFPGEGRPIPRYPRTPKWCPGMVRRPRLDAGCDAAPRR